jgi:hypothetical protein
VRGVRTACLLFVAVFGGTFAGCSSSDTPPAGCTATLDVLVAMSDYDSSACGAVTVDARLPPSLAAGPDLGKDPQLVVSGGRAFFVARDRDTVFELSPACGLPSASFSTADPAHKGSTNPQDVAVAPDGALWVPRLAIPSIVVIDRDGKQRAAIDISRGPRGLTDPDGNPNASAIRIADVGGKAKAFVALEILDDNDQLASKLDSKMLRIDVATMTIEDEIVLAGRDPFNTMAEHAGAFFLGAPGNFDALGEDKAGIERFDPIAFSSKLLVPEKELGGSVTALAITQGCGAAIVADATPSVNATALVTFDPDTGAIVTSLAASPLKTDGFDLLAIAWKDDVLLVGDRRRAASGYPIHAFQRKPGTCALTPLPDRIFVAQKPIVLRTPG